MMGIKRIKKSEKKAWILNKLVVYLGIRDEEKKDFE
jgi:hypothetical protein